MRTCSIDGCNKPHLAKGYCRLHYTRVLKYGDPQKCLRVRSYEGVVCSESGCDGKAVCRGLCTIHYDRFRKHGDPRAGGTRRGDPLRFFEDVVLKYDRDCCLTWPYSKTTGGYGTLTVAGLKHYVHRLSCESRHGKSPSPLHQAAHSCGNGHLGCVNPHHLEWKTRAENEADKVAHGTSNRGERCGTGKLSEREVRDILQLKGKMLQREIAERFGVTRQQIQKIHARKCWGWLSIAKQQSSRSHERKGEAA